VSKLETHLRNGMKRRIYQVDSAFFVASLALVSDRAFAQGGSTRCQGGSFSVLGLAGDQRTTVPESSLGDMWSAPVSTLSGRKAWVPSLSAAPSTGCEPAVPPRRSLMRIWRPPWQAQPLRQSRPWQVGF
jgi:hypothetical protein